MRGIGLVGILQAASLGRVIVIRNDELLLARHGEAQPEAPPPRQAAIQKCDPPAPKVHAQTREAARRQRQFERLAQKGNKR
jgi:hypothetical protein